MYDHTDYQRWLTDLGEAINISELSQQELADELGLNKRTVYRILHKKSMVGLKQYLVLTKKFNLIPIGGHDRLVLSMPPSRTSIDNFDSQQYLASLSAAASLLDVDSHLDVLTSELPVFYIFEHAALTQHKFHFFECASRHDAAVSPIEDLQGLGVLRAKYEHIKRREIWGPDPLRSFCHQLEQMTNEQKLDSKQLEVCYNALKSLLDSIKVQLLDQTAKFELRVQETIKSAARYIIYDKREINTAFIPIDNPGFMQTSEATSTQYFARQFDNAWHRARPISGSQTNLQAYFSTQDLALERRFKRMHSIKD